MYRLWVTVWSLAADDGDAGFLTAAERGAQLVVGVADLESEVVEADMPARRQGLRVLADLDEQQLVVRPTRC